MSSEEKGKNEEEKSQREEILVPLYFDRYVTSELRTLGQRITDLKESVDERFAQVDRRFVEFKESMDERFAQIDRRFVEFKESMDERFAQVDRRFVEFKEDVDKRFDKLDATLKWIIGLVIGLFSPIIIGIVAIIIKMFISGK